MGNPVRAGIMRSAGTDSLDPSVLSGAPTRRTVLLDVVDPRRIGDATLEHVWNAWSFEHSLLLLREEVSRSGGDWCARDCDP